MAKLWTCSNYDLVNFRIGKQQQTRPAVYINLQVQLALNFAKLHSQSVEQQLAMDRDAFFNSRLDTASANSPARIRTGDQAIMSRGL